MLSNLLALFAGLVLWTPGGQAPIRPPVLPKSWQVLAFRQLVKCKRAAIQGGGTQHSRGSPPRQRRHTSSAAPGREARPTPSAANSRRAAQARKTFQIGAFAGSHSSLGLFSGLREGSPPAVHQCCQTWQVLSFRQLVKYKRAALLGGGAQHSPGRPPRQRRHTSSVAPGREARPTPSATNS